MKIVAINKTLNEADFIADYCHNHAFCDLILVADGGSTDGTPDIARRYDNVLVREFDQRIPTPGDGFMNPEPAHTNFLLDWADEVGADWVLFVGCDTWPGLFLQNDARELLGNIDSDGVNCYTLYLWRDDQYFPLINQVGPGGWAFRGGLGLRCDERHATFFDTPMVWPEKTIYLWSEYFLLHYWGSPQRTPKKMVRYEAWGHPQSHPLESIYAPPEPLPEWIMSGMPKRIPK